LKLIFSLATDGSRASADSTLLIYLSIPSSEK